MMQRPLIIVEAVGIYGIALSLVWVWRLEWGAVAGWAWWLIPFTWIVAASLPGLWAPRNWLSWQAFCGRLSSVLWEVVRLSLLVFPAFGIAYLLYFSGEILPETGFRFGAGWWNMIFYQFVYVGFSEELFFRGYLQQRLDEVFGRPYRLFGVRWGLGLIGANLMFAIGHGVVGGSVKRLDVFFPGLLFGWLQARTGAVIAP